LGLPGAVGFTTANVSGLVSENVILASEKLQKGCASCKNKNAKEIAFAENKLGLRAETLDGTAKQNYFNLLQSIQGFADLSKKLSVYKVVRVNPVNYIYISGTFQKPMDNTLLYAIINGKTGEIALLKTVQYNKDDTNVIAKDFLKDGITTKISLSEMAQKSEENKQLMDAFISANSNASTEQIAVAAKAPSEHWICSFAGVIACVTGCAVFIAVPLAYTACEIACNYFWSNGLCD